MNQARARDFLLEIHENLDLLDRELVQLEAEPGSARTLDSVFRTIHTIKGTCGFMACTRLEAIAHVGETLLASLRGGALMPSAAITTALLAMSDAVRQVLAVVETTGGEGDADHSSLIATLEGLTVPGAAPTAPRPPAAVPKAPSRHRRPGLGADRPVRIDVASLDSLETLIGELALVRDQIVELDANAPSGALAGASRRLTLVTASLQAGIARARRQPIDSLWSHVPRLVRDLALQSGKQVRLQLEAADVALDRGIVEAMRAPLTHIVRNAVDHGIEAPEVRVQRGKPRDGVIALRAVHEAGRLTVTIADDGAGLSPARILADAQRRGLITADQAGGMAEPDVLRLIFLPGLSTAEHVSSISGRGVGMDIVRTGIESIAGQVEIDSRAGYGTRFTITIPLTLGVLAAAAAATRQPAEAVA